MTSSLKVRSWFFRFQKLDFRYVTGVGTCALNGDMRAIYYDRCPRCPNHLLLGLAKVFSVRETGARMIENRSVTLWGS